MKENKKMNNTDFMMAKGTMTLDTFADMMKDALSSYIEDCTFEVQETKKNNGVVLHGIRIIDPESNIAPVIYLDEVFKEYQNGRNFNEIVTMFIENYEKNRLTVDFDVKDIMDYERVKEKICYKVINTALNKELLADVPHVPFYDLSVVFYVRIDSIPGQGGSIMIHNSFLPEWGVDKDMLFEIAKANTQRLLEGKVMPMNDIIADILNDENCRVEELLPDEDCCMYVATNREKMNGAAVFLDDSLLSGFADKIGRDFYILPSSIHELIFLPYASNMEPERIKEMISEVNSTSVREEEILSYNLYRYRRETGLVELVA